MLGSVFIVVLGSALNTWGLVLISTELMVKPIVIQHVAFQQLKPAILCLRLDS